MESREPPRPGPDPPGTRSISISRLLKKLSTKDSSSSASRSATPEAGTSQNRPRRHLNPTEEDLESNAADLQQGLSIAWPNRHHSRYRRARALLVCWADNELVNTYCPPSAAPQSPAHSNVPPSPSTGSGQDVRTVPRMASRTDMRSSTVPAGQNARQGPFIPAAYELADVLQRRYGIGSQVWMIPSLENPQDMLVGKITQFVAEYGGPDNLLIFWYGGSAEFIGPANEQEGGSGQGELVWYGLRDDLGIPARAITKALGAARADVLMLNDSPFAQLAYTGHVSGPGTFELLGSGSIIPSNLDQRAERAASFTRTLSLMLDSSYLAAHGVSVPELHRKLIDILSRNRSDSTMTASPSSPTSPTSPTSTASPTSPASPNLAPSGSIQGAQRSRRFVPYVVSRAPATEAPAYPVYCQIAQSSHVERSARRNIVISRLDVPLSAQVVHTRGSIEPRVRLDIRLERPFIDVRRWKEWILNAPSDIIDVAFKVCGKDK